MRIEITYARTVIKQATEVIEVESEEEAHALAMERVLEINAGTDQLDWTDMDVAMGAEAVELREETT